MERVVIVEGVRTAIGGYGGTLKDFAAWQLGKIVIEEVLKRSKIEGDQVDEVLMGNILQAGQGMHPTRQASLAANVPNEVPVMTVNKVCGSGLKTVALAAQSIKLGEGNIIVAGGMESMSQAPYYLPQARWGYKMGHGKVEDAMIKDGLWCSLTDQHMGNTAEAIAEKYNISREEQDEFAAGSQAKAQKALEEGWFKEEIVPVEIPQRKKDPIIFTQDEHPRPGVTADKLAKMRPAFNKDGSVTAGNASGINDGAAALVIMSESKAKELGLEPIAYLESYASAGVDPLYMGMGPVPAVKKALDKANLTINDIDLVEANEAFAVQALAVGKELGFKENRVNVGGGAIALGHPIGASGARILVTLLGHMKRLDKETGLATLCIGGGMGIAAVIRRA